MFRFKQFKIYLNRKIIYTHTFTFKHLFTIDSYPFAFTMILMIAVARSHLRLWKCLRFLFFFAIFLLKFHTTLQKKKKNFFSPTYTNYYSVHFKFFLVTLPI
jgi:hypothetical protein